MTTYEELSKKSDQALIKLITSTYDGPDKNLAGEILEYRKYLATKKQNQAIVWLTIVMTISSIIDVIIQLVR